MTNLSFIQQKRYIYIFLVFFLVLGTCLRFYKLGEIPNSLNWDEVSWGYNAYSIAETGRDEWGNGWPLSFRAFGDYKQPVYVYLTAASIKLFGLSAFSVRFSSAFFGSLSILVAYVLAKELCKKKTTFIALLTAALLALSPWHIQFSRVAYEANVGLFFVMLGVWMFLKGTRTTSWKWLYWSIVPLTLSAMTYHSQKIFTPLLFAGLILYAYRFLLTNRRLAFGLAVVFILLNSIWALDARTTARGRSVTIFSNQTKVLSPSIDYMEYDREHHDRFGALLHNRRIVYALKYAENYLSHLNPVFLFVEGDDVRHHAPGMGVLYLSLLPFIMVGIRKLILERGGESKLVLYWFLIAPVAASLAIDAPNASRSLIFLPTWQLFGAVGLVTVGAYLFTLRRWPATVIVIAGIAIIFTGNVLYYIHHYFVHTAIETERDWQYGYEQVMDMIPRYTGANIFIDPSIEQGYIFYLFHTNYDPARYLANGGSYRKMTKCYEINGIHFGDCFQMMITGDILVSARFEEENSYALLDEITYSDGSAAIYILEKQ